MKQLRVLAAIVVASAVSAVTSSVATAGSTESRVAIGSNALFTQSGLFVDVQLSVQCSGVENLGEASVTVTQQNQFGMVEGTSTKTVPCDGQQHDVALTVAPGPFELGEAFATATLTAASGGATDERTIEFVIL